MKASDKTKAQLVEELAHLRQQIAELEAMGIEQGRVARASRESEQYSTLRGIIDSANALIFSVDRQYRYTSFNQGHAAVMKALYGVEIEPGHSLLDYMTVEGDRETAKNNLDRALAGEQLVEEAYSGEELRSRRYFQVSHSPIVNEEGQIIGVAVLAQDITERKLAEAALYRVNRELRAISNCNQTLLRAVDEQTLLNEICRIVCDEAGYRMAWVGYAQNDEAKTVRPVAWAGVEDGYLEQAWLTWSDTERGRGPAGTAIGSGEITYTQDFTTDPRMAPWRESALQRGYRSSITLPLKDENARTFGILSIYSSEPHAFTSDEIQLLEELAGDLAFGINTLRMRAERTRAEEVLIETHSLLEQSARFTAALLAAIPTPVFYKDREGRYLGCNRAFTEVMGVTSAEITGKTVYELWPSEHAQVYHSKDLELMENPALQVYEFTVRDKYGVDRPVIYVKDVFRDENDQVAGIVGAFLDITERKKAEMQILASEQLFRALVENSPDFISRYDREFRRVYVNPAIQKLFGRPVEDVLNQTPADQSPVYAPDVYIDQLRQVMETAAERAIEMPFRTTQGEMHWGHMRFVPEFGPDGRVASVLAIGRDIHEIKENERRFRTLAENFPDFVVRFDHDCRFTYVNPAVETTYGLSTAALLGKTLQELPQHRPERDDALITLIRRAFDEGVANETEARWDTEMGERIFEIRYVPEKDATGNVVTVLSIAHDITERKRAEEILQRSEEKYRTLVETLNEVIFTVDMQGRFIYISPAIEHYTGFSPDEVIGQPFTRFVHPDDLPGLTASFEHSSAGHQEPYEFRVYSKDGAIRYMHTLSRVLVEEGQAVGLTGILSDITERKQAEDALRQNREAALRFSEQLAALQQVTIQLSKAKSSDDLCRQAVELARSHLGFDRVGIWFIEEDRGFMRGSFGTDEQGKLRDERNLRVEFRHEGLGWEVYSQKQPVAYSEHTTLVHQGQEVGEGNLAAGALWDGDQVIGLVYTDNLISHQSITEQQLEILRLYATTLGHLLKRIWAEEERERLAAQIREQARELRQILATVPEGVLLLDSERRVVQTNPVAEKDLTILAGVKAGDILTHLGDRSLAELLTSPPTRGLWHEVKADQRVFEVIARPMENGLEPEHWVLVINDVTQAREVREQLQQQERMAAVGQLAAGIAHDFNNIMAIIVLYAQMTAQVEALPPHVQERMAVIDQQARHATRLIQQILDFSRRSVLERQPLDLLPLLKEQCKLLERTLPENIEISLDYEPAEYIVNADPTRMQQILMNLAVNARDAMPEGGKLRFSLSRTAPTDNIGCVACDEVPSGEWVRIAVADTGSGIPSEALPHIFEPFFTTKAPGQGTGLGLPQVYGIVGAHEGHIDVRTKIGKGTSFIIYLPPLLAHQPETPVLETLPLVSGEGETLLVVEDDATLRKALLDILRSLNYQVLEAANGQEALDTLQQSAREIALVISDLVMPGMGGQALFHAMRRRNLTLPMIILSGHPMEQELQSLQAEGLAGWLLKPPDIEQLSHLLARVLKEK